MNLEMAESIMQKENLKNYCLFCKGDYTALKVVIQKSADNKWTVFTNDEKAAKTGEAVYDNESEALDDFIERLRADKILRGYYGKSI